MESTDYYADFSDDAIGAAPEAEATTPTGEEPAASQPPVEQPSQTQEQPQQPAPEAEAQGGEEFNPEGPGNPAEAFRAYRQQIAELRAAQAQAQAEMQQYRDYFANLQAQQQEAELAQQLEQYSDDPEAIARILQHKQHEFQQQAARQQQEAALRMGADFARATLPDFDAQVGKLYQMLGPEVVDHLAAQQANGPLWAYQLAQNLRTPEEFNQAVESRAQALAAEIVQRANPKAPTSSRGIGQIPAAAPNQVQHPSSDAAKALNFGPMSASFDSAYESLLRAAGG
ncbi:MAG: hypothetical protein VW405_06240 [Rhodospirillaceae bacterium]